jgi:hypothetical protein
LLLVQYQDGDSEEVDLEEAREIVLPVSVKLTVPVSRASHDPQRLVGRRVRKQFESGVFEGVIDGYLPRHGWWHIIYEVSQRVLVEVCSLPWLESLECRP